MDAVAIFGGDDTNLGSSLFQGFQHCNGFGEELGIGGHMYVRFFHIFFFIGDECIFVGDAGQDAEWVFKCFSDGAFDTFIGYIGVSVAC